MLTYSFAFPSIQDQELRFEQEKDLLQISLEKKVVHSSARSRSLAFRVPAPSELTFQDGARSGKIRATINERELRAAQMELVYCSAAFGTHSVCVWRWLISS